jgi:large subunit ribosomal protein L15
VPDATLPLKVLGHGDIAKKLTVVAAKFSESAKAKIEKAGGTAKVAE